MPFQPPSNTLLQSTKTEKCKRIKIRSKGKQPGSNSVTNRATRLYLMYFFSKIVHKFKFSEVNLFHILLLKTGVKVLVTSSYTPLKVMQHINGFAQIHYQRMISIRYIIHYWTFLLAEGITHIISCLKLSIILNWPWAYKNWSIYSNTNMYWNSGLQPGRQQPLTYSY